MRLKKPEKIEDKKTFFDVTELMKFEHQIRFGICEGECTVEKVAECGEKCPMNNFLDQFISMMDLLQLMALIHSRKPVPKKALKEIVGENYNLLAKKLDKACDDISEAMSPKSRQVAQRTAARTFFDMLWMEYDPDSPDDCKGVVVDSVVIPEMFFYYLLNLNMLEGNYIVVLKGSGDDFISDKAGVPYNVEDSESVLAPDKMVVSLFGRSGGLKEKTVTINIKDYLLKVSRFVKKDKNEEEEGDGEDEQESK